MFGNNNQDSSNDQQTQSTSNDLPSLGQENGVPTLPSMPASAQAVSPFGGQQSAPTNDGTTAEDTVTPSAPVATEPESAAPSDSAVHHTGGHAGDINGANGDLVAIKQQALQHLSPLVSHLDQSAEEKFRTTMMMIQATDDQSLLKAAYEAAQKIEDDKARAQALLDVINEINYFTQQHSA